MSEMFATINANSEKVQQNAIKKHSRALARQRATKSFMARLTGVAVFLLILLALISLGMIDGWLATMLAFAAVAYGGIWLGAWLQYMFADGGVLNGSK